MPVYHNMQNQTNLMIQTPENDQKPQIWENLGPFCQILAQKFSSKIGLFYNQANPMIFKKTPDRQTGVNLLDQPPESVGPKNRFVSSVEPGRSRNGVGSKISSNFDFNMLTLRIGPF